MIRVKVCCISNAEEARLAVKHGASALGLVSEMPSGPGVISEDTIAEIASITPPGVATFLLTSKQDIDSIIAQQKRCGVNTIQLCDHVTKGTYKELKAAMPGVSLVHVVHVNGMESIDEALSIINDVDGILLDSGSKLHDIKKLGGTGKIHDWEISAEIVKRVNKPVYLAGGLNSTNIKEAVAKVKPFGVDLCNGVRTEGKLDEEKLSRFFNIINEINFE
ncbi:MAG: phosphoribosylanthranilate isomerase [bacterium]